MSTHYQISFNKINVLIIKKKVYLILLLNSESQNIILSDKFDNNMMLKLYVNNLQYMLKILSEHLNNDMKLLNCDSF